MATQKQRLLLLLEARGFKGVSAYELVYTHGITRGAAIVHELRTKDGIDITTIDEGDSKLARYVLTKSIGKVPVPCHCGHKRTVHVSNEFRCLDMLNPEAYLEPVQPCPCERYHAA